MKPFFCVYLKILKMSTVSVMIIANAKIGIAAIIGKARGLIMSSKNIVFPPLM